ncbi:pilus assembly protein TadG-related protein [Novipirellula caenicola]|uniref:Putative Flp pilus-assembly TadG-like N-terminal domain-containing protein n=1 Tax=Novipirellula caenicola TaxID=1536901 RepID=A0ABP9VJQ4_9BACT
MLQRRLKNRRGGYVLVLVATMLFGLFAMAALVIDLGFARVAQRQMQTAADAAALEGLRGEGIVSYGDRQVAAEVLIAWTFDDDLDETNGDIGALGGGPIVAFSGGAGNLDLNASELMTVDTNDQTYKPTMQRSLNPVNGSEFTVAIQRGGTVLEPYDLLSEGPSVPYLFARGSLLNRESIGDGIAAGGVARAVTEKALSVGPPINDTAGSLIYPGAIAIGYSLADWNGSRSNPRQMDTPKTVIGQTVTDVGGATPIDGYCCIFSTIDGVDRVVGFGRIEGAVALPSSVAIANAIGRQGSAWNQIDATVRDDVMTQNKTIVGGLLVARLAPGT